MLNERYYDVCGPHDNVHKCSSKGSRTHITYMDHHGDLGRRFDRVFFGLY